MGKGNKQGKSKGGFKKQGSGSGRGGGGRGRGRGRGGGGRGFDWGGRGGFGGRRKLEITFDPEARREYLTGMSARKKERRVFGLAMQKIKDRRDKLDRKKEDRKSRLEKVEEAEKLKRLAKGQGEDDDDDESESGSDSGDEASVSSSEQKSKSEKSKKKRSKPGHDEVEETQQTYSDANTTSQFGGSVIVTTTYGIPSDDESDDPDIQGIVSNKPHVDEEQRYAGNVKKYMSQVRSNLPNKKRKREQMGGGGGHRKGKHGASDMKGMGSGTDLKMAKKALGRAAGQDRAGGGMDRGGKKGKRGKKGRR